MQTPKTSLRESETPQFTIPNRLLTKDELAQRLAICRRSVENLMHQRRIPFVRLGGKLVRFDWERVKEALAKFEIKESVR
ncbi:MAG: excisionase family DNA-binding protein [Verrucomicrobia bacterium]|nr:excisionase family DNA-binding protein [Verrucomicrobiota bacterium]